MKKLFLVTAVVVAMVASVLAAGADTGLLPGGTSIEVTITSPEDGNISLGGPFSLEGTASVEMGTAVKDTSLVYILDVSGSTSDSAGVDCDGDEDNDSILECEKEAVRRVNASAAASTSPVLNSGIGKFANSGSVVQPLIAPGAGIDTAVSGISGPNGGTDFGAGLQAANTILSDPAAADQKVVVFLTDGEGSGSSSLPDGTIVLAFAIGSSSSCSENLVAISDECIEVEDLSDLPEVIGDSVGSTLDSLTYSIDGGPSVAIETTPALPQDGPATVSFDVDLAALSVGSHEICVEASGTDAGGSGTVSDCVDAEVVEATVDCSNTEEECTLEDDDGGISNAVVEGLGGFDKRIGIRSVPVDPEECGGDECTTSYDVLFGGEGTSGYAELTVLIASKEDSTAPGQAAVFIDGVEITDQCNKKATKSPIPCAKISRTGSGQTLYFVRFAADPGFHFR